MLIAQITDTHLALDTPDADQRIRDFETVVADINALDPQPDLIVHTGDIVHNGRAEEYAEACRILQQAHAPFYVVPGNKDDRAQLCAAFAADGYLALGQDFVQYAVEGYPVRLVMLDTVSQGRNKGDFCAERVDGLNRLIDDGSAKPVAIFLHHPPFEVMVGPERTHFVSAAAMSRLRDALRQSGRVIAIFCGHVHRPTRGRIGEILVTVATAVATTLRKGEYPAEAGGRPIYSLHSFDPDRGFANETRFARTRR